MGKLRFPSASLARVALQRYLLRPLGVPLLSGYVLPQSSDIEDIDGATSYMD